MKITKQDIWHLDLQEMPMQTDEAQLWCEEQKLNSHHTWTMPQLVAWFATWEIQRDGRQTVLHNCNDDPHKQKLYTLTRINRSALVPNQTRFPQYGTFTPLILMGFKQNRDLKYETWRKFPELKWLLEPRLFECLMVDQPEVTKEELLQIRQQGLVYQTGKQQGQMRQPESTWAMSGIKDTKLGYLPKLTQTMLCQNWLCHPKHRHQYQILNLENWDLMPEIIIEEQTLQQPKTLPEPTKKKKPQNLLPWDLDQD